MTGPDSGKLDRVLAAQRAANAERDKSYRERALKLYPWICGRCAREFSRANLRELTVHHVDHNHDNNPPDGSNWELLCVYCHDEEHAKYTNFERHGSVAEAVVAPASHSPFANLKEKMQSLKEEIQTKD